MRRVRDIGKYEWKDGKMERLKRQKGTGGRRKQRG
jgi:hypothetical protein